MRELLAAGKIKTAMQPFLDKGFFFEYFYEKGENGEPVYICRFKKGKSSLDWRESEDGSQIAFWVKTKEKTTVLNLKERFPKQHRRFFWKHFFRKATIDERRIFLAKLLVLELESENHDFFGIEK